MIKRVQMIDAVLIVDSGQVQYHRNGSGGEGFHLVRFIRESYSDQETPQVLLAQVSNEQMSRGDLSTTTVIDPFDIDSKWRGDTFDAPLRRALNELSFEVKIAVR